eukprot:535138_1
MTFIFSDSSWNASSGIYDITAFIIACVCLSRFVYQFYCKNTENDLILSMKVACIMYVLFYCIRYFQASIYFILYPDRLYNRTQDRIDTFIGAVGFVIAHTSFYIIMFLRLYYAFIADERSEFAFWLLHLPPLSTHSRKFATYA